MRKFGLIGGTSWHSTAMYYSTINRIVNERFSDNTNPPLRLVSLNQKQVHDLQRADDWEGIADLFAGAGRELERLEVQGMALCASTPHRIFDSLQRWVSCPILHMADAIGAFLGTSRWNRVGLLGTRFTMAQDFLKGRLRDRFQVTTLVPDAQAQQAMQERIYSRLSVGVFDDDTRAFCQTLVNTLAGKGAQAVVLGCTELPLLMNDTASSVPLVDSLRCHCEDIVRFILKEK